MRVDLFDFELPDELIAQRPVSPRNSARLLDVTGEALQDRTVRSLPGLLRRGDLLVFNDTRVIPARLKGVRPGNGVRQDVAAEALLIRDLGDRRWRAFARPAKRLRPGDKLVFNGLGATVEAKEEDGSLVLAFDQEGHAFLTVLEQEGTVPLPPYIRGGTADAQDREDYQTVFARRDGAVAAPTAGLHFTPELLAALADARRRDGAASRCMSAPAPSCRCASTNRAPTRLHAEWGEVPRPPPRAIDGDPHRRRAHRRDRHHGAAPAGNGGADARRRDQAVPSGETDLFITPGLSASAPSTC